MTKEEIKRLQENLNRLGGQPELVVDGLYGPATRRVVINLQSRSGLVTDGVAGPLTLAEVARQIAGGTITGIGRGRRMRIILVRGKLGSIFSLGMDTLAGKLNQIPGVTATTQSYGLFYSEVDDITVALEAALNGGYTHVGCVGHSMGGDTAAKVAWLLHGAGKKLDLLGPVDPTPFGCPTAAPNVAVTIGYANTLFFQLGGHEIVKAPGYSGKFSVTRLAMPHTTIDDDAGIVHKSYVNAVKEMIA